MMPQIPYGEANWAVTKCSHPAEDFRILSRVA